MGTTTLLSAISDIAQKFEMVTLSGDKSLIANSELYDRTLWVQTPVIKDIVGVFDRVVKYDIELYYIEFVSQEDNRNANQMMDLMCNFISELAQHSAVEHLSVSEMVPMDKPMTKYGERCLRVKTEMKILDCEHVFI